jgi:hypothetical protein
VVAPGFVLVPLAGFLGGFPPGFGVVGDAVAQVG